MLKSAPKPGVSSSFILNAAGIVEVTASRALSASDNGKVLHCTNAALITIDCATGLGKGFSCTIIQGGAGKVTIAAGAATLNSYSGLFSTMGRYAVISVICPEANQFIAAGNLGV
jgi:hypothetical protein